jgi:hypothetical protein
MTKRSTEKSNRSETDIIDEIMNNLRPLRSKSEKKIYKEVQKDISRLQRQIRLYPEFCSNWQAGREIEPALTDLINAINNLPKDYILFVKCGGREWRKDLLERLLHLRHIYDGPMAELEPPRSNYDRTARECAMISWSLMDSFSENQPTREDDRPMNAIACLLYEAITGGRPNSLRRACNDVLRALKLTLENIRKSQAQIS